MPVFDAFDGKYNNTKYGSSTYAALEDKVNNYSDEILRKFGTKEGFNQALKEAKEQGLTLEEYMNKWSTQAESDIFGGMAKGEYTGSDMLNLYGAHNIDMPNAIANSVNNQIAQDNATQAYNRELEARDTSLLSQAGQLTSLGMNPGSVTTIGGASTPSVGQASSPASKAVQKFDNKAHVLGSVLNLVGRLGQGAVYGATRSMLNRSIGPMARSTIKTAKQAVIKPEFDQKFYDSLPDDWDSLIQML